MQADFDLELRSSCLSLCWGLQGLQFCLPRPGRDHVSCRRAAGGRVHGDQDQLVKSATVEHKRAPSEVCWSLPHSAAVCYQGLLPKGISVGFEHQLIHFWYLPAILWVPTLRTQKGQASSLLLSEHFFPPSVDAGMLSLRIKIPSSTACRLVSLYASTFNVLLIKTYTAFDYLNV